MTSALQDLLAGGIGAFLLIFIRIGTAFSLFPGLGDMFTPLQIRLLLALAISLALTPTIMLYFPAQIPLDARIIPLAFMEFLIGAFIGTVTRIILSALDVAATIISIQSGLANAQLFNPAFATQGSIMGAFLTLGLVALIFITNMHHFMIAGLLNSYQIFALGTLPVTEDMANTVSQLLSGAFLIGVQLSAPVLVVVMILNVAMGILARLMPHMQIFTFAIQLQIMLSFLVLMFSFSALFTYWLAKFKDVFVTLFS